MVLAYRTHGYVFVYALLSCGRIVYSWPSVFQEESRARDLFYGLWIPDLFMQRVQSNGEWSLFCPNEAPGLADCWGEEFERLYSKYEAEVSTTLRYYTEL